ncbi:RICIN domain-containing protein [Streptomyces sp. NRRL B-24484]|uniref:RICIN domain-containing protein n=1 Tax=Streptomyces sp. NRRL B-24484 TaxID=1463833 RepID=UPI0004BF7AD9|nr:RICIN domain-containing protein [Streptomyces sp. NRRL B-24484]
MSDPAADPPSDAERTRRPAVRPLTTRESEALIAYARRLCRDARAARELTEEVFAADLRGTDPEHARQPALLAAARRTAATWADSGRADLLSPAFAAWLRTLPRPNASAQCAQAAVVAAEEDSALLQVFRKLPDALRAAVWQALDDAPEPAPPSPATDDAADANADASAAGLPDPEVVARFYGAYLQYYVVHAPRRSCRQLVARLGDTVRRGDTDEALDRHLARCGDCTRARADLAAVHTWQRPALRAGLLLWTGEERTGDRRTGEEAPEAADTVVLPALPAGLFASLPQEGTPPPAPVPVPVATPVPVPVPVASAVALPSSTGPSDPDAAGAGPQRHSDRTVVFALLALGLGILTVAAATIAPDRAAPTAAAPPASPSRAASRAAVPPKSSPTAPAPWTPVSPAPDGGSPAPVPPTAADTPSPSPTSRIPAFRLVNVRSGLCVLPDDPGGRDGGGVHLGTCDGSAAQRWQFLQNSSGLLQVRNAAGGQCLDGTTAGGNVVAVVLQECRADRREQLWKAVASSRPAAFRLHFVPCVTKSDYTDHLLGPGGIWPGPARAGSPVVHQPNYYDKDDFLFTTV